MLGFGSHLPSWEITFSCQSYFTSGVRLETLTNATVNDITLENETHFSAQIITNPYFVPDDVNDTFTGFIVNSDDVLSEIYFMVYFPDASDVDWTPYKLPNVLRSYGIPDEVKTSFAVDGATGYYLTLKYSALHLSIRYRVILPNLDHAPLPNDTFLICNTFDPNILEISILLDESRTSQYFVNVNDPDFVDFTGIDNMTFSEIFSEDNACIETLPRGQWPED
ncbi:MAG: hypothetical protein BroJett018_24000 [Chloroflexota bacterium]|nr:MAG: hypothetical protein BroJett018_24000 [Chloroflexota bacterium]